MEKTTGSNIPQEDSLGCKEENKKQKPKKQENSNDEACTTVSTVPVMESASHVKPFNTSKSSSQQQRCPHSKRWREELVAVEAFRANKTEITQLGCGYIYYRNDPKFCIAKGIDGTEIFLGLSDDGIEVAIKRMSKDHVNYRHLKDEDEILRLPGLKSTFIVQRRYFTEDEKCGYLCVQLFENTLEEYINDCPEAKLYQIMRFILKAVKLLHGQDPPIFHQDVSPQTFWIGERS